MTTEAVAIFGWILALIAVAVAALSWLVYGGLRQRAGAISPSFVDLENAYGDLSKQMDAMREQQASDNQAIRQLRAEVLRIDADLQRWRIAYAVLAHEFMNATGRAPSAQPPDAPAAAQPPAPASDTARLAALLVECFGPEELDGLAFELGLAAAVAGDTVEARARSLVAAARRRKRLDALIALCRRERPEGGF